MIGTSIRVRLTVWYVAALTIATLSVAGASWWLSTQSVIHAADSGLEARVDGQEVLYARSQLVLDSAAAGIRSPFDIVHLAIRDDAGGPISMHAYLRGVDRSNEG